MVFQMAWQRSFQHQNSHAFDFWANYNDRNPAGWTAATVLSGTTGERWKNMEKWWFFVREMLPNPRKNSGFCPDLKPRWRQIKFRGSCKMAKQARDYMRQILTIFWHTAWGLSCDSILEVQIWSCQKNNTTWFASFIQFYSIFCLIFLTFLFWYFVSIGMFLPRFLQRSLGISMLQGLQRFCSFLLKLRCPTVAKQDCAGHDLHQRRIRLDATWDSNSSSWDRISDFQLKIL